MKKMLTLAVCLLMAAVSFAQPQQGQKRNDDARKKEFERIQAE